MPPGAGVVDAFKSALLVVAHGFPLILLTTDLIRRGKHHNQNRHDSAPANSRDLRQPQEVSNAVTHTPAVAARIVGDEERKGQSIMPTYKGLEHFKLEVKMGEWVFPLIARL
jgi:hypothetical protein